MSNPRSHVLWKDFEDFAKTNGIELDYREDWEGWWECFLAGARAQVDQIANRGTD